MLIRVPAPTDGQSRELKARAARGERLTAAEQTLVSTAEAREVAFTGKDDGKLVTMGGLVPHVGTDRLA